MKMNIEQTKNGNDVIVVELDTGEIFKGYTIGKKFQFSKDGKDLCYLSEKEAHNVFKKANDIAKYGGNVIAFLKSYKTRTRGNQTETSKDGLYKFQYYSRQDKAGITICAVYNGKERQIRPYLPFGETDKAKEIIKEVCNEYDTTGRFKSERTSLRGTPFPHEYFDETKEENLNLDEHYYDSLNSYILNGFDDNGNSLLTPGETLHICCIDGFEIGLEDTDSLRVNENGDLFIIHTCNAPDNELIIPVDKISRVLLSRE